MNVYPAAGLLNYVPRDAEVYLIDPKPVDVHSMRQIHVIQKGARGRTDLAARPAGQVPVTSDTGI